MNLTSTFRIAFRNLLKNKMRSILTSLGVIIGVCSVVVMISIGTGTQKSIQNQIASLGTNLLIITQKMNRTGGVVIQTQDNRLTLTDVDKIRKNAPSVEYISPMIQSARQIIANGNNWYTQIYGVSQDFFSIRSLTIGQGELFTEADAKSRKKVAVLGKTVADELFPNDSAVGQTIRIGNVPFKVIGILNAKGKSSFGQDQDDVVIAPDATVMARLSGSRFIRMIYASAYNEELQSSAKEEIASAMRDAHKIKEGQEDDFEIGSQEEILQTASQMAATLTMFLGAIAGVSLIVGGIGIMNIMLVSVTERTREIGIRMAVGARSRDVLIQFLIEAVVLSISGGMIGIVLSLAISFIFNTFTSILTVINVNIIILSFVFSGSVGVFFGFYPARKASNLNPIDALRYE